MEGITVMVVEGEAAIGMDIRKTLKRLGYRVPPVVSSGEKALEKVADIAPDLILMDIFLHRGQLNGIDAAKTIRDRFNLPVVFLTDRADTHTLDRDRQTQPFGYLVKPFEERELQATVEIALARYQAECKMQKALATERELNELKTRFVSIVSHEFRTPLATIMGSTELLENYAYKWSDEKKKIHFNRISTSVQYMTQMLDDILTLEKSEADCVVFNPQPIDIVAFSRSLVEEWQAICNSACTIQLEIKDNRQNDSPLVLDDNLSIQILSNLISNAIKYSPASSSILLAIECRDREVSFAVSDRGIGIPEAESDRIFDSFYRCENAGAIRGMGLGLTIVKKAVDLHGGTINFCSREGEGTTFTVTLPLS